VDKRKKGEASQAPGQNNLKRASKFQQSTKHKSRDHDDESTFVRVRKNPKSLLAPQLSTTAIAPEVQDLNGTLITTLGGGWCLVFMNGQEVKCRIPFSLVESAAAGDRVFVEGEQLRALGPRRTVLSRPDPHLVTRERVIACNIDIVVVVSSWKSPPPRFGLLDRYLIAIQRGGAQAVICFNKSDLCSDEEKHGYQEQLSLYQNLSVPLLDVSAESKVGLDALRELVRGKRIAFVGHSGVGKTSLRNALDSSRAELTGEVGRKGRHTTSSTSLTVLPDGTELFDTPGIRELGLWKMGPEELGYYFPEFAPFVSRCRFSDCTHRREPDCAVLFAVESGEISRVRYQTFLRLGDG
jgi:ribosome biogenesis GTPase / thiamine phosphate phosphatase